MQLGFEGVEHGSDFLREPGRGWVDVIRVNGTFDDEAHVRVIRWLLLHSGVGGCSGCFEDLVKQGEPSGSSFNGYCNSV